jgi:hypothetical protein
MVARPAGGDLGRVSNLIVLSLAIEGSVLLDVLSSYSTCAVFAVVRHHAAELV